MSGDARLLEGYRKVVNMIELKCQFLTPPGAAKYLGVSHQKILDWIDSGELRAVNVAARHGGRPRWRIAEEDLKAFMDRRSSSPEPKVKRRRRKVAGRI